MDRYIYLNKHAVQNKLRSNIGETIGETLVSLLIASLALLMLAGAITATKHMIDTSANKLSAYYKQDSVLVDQSTAAITGTVEISNGGVSETQNVNFFKNESFGRIYVVSYTKQ